MTVNPLEVLLEKIEVIEIENTNSSISETYYPGDLNIINLAEYNFSHIVEKYTEEQFLSNYVDGNYTKAIFPTYAESSGPEVKYFGSINISGGFLYYLEIGPGFDTIKIYETESGEVSAELIFDNDENKFWKLLYVYVSSNRIKDINLAYEMWKIDPNPHRNKNKYVLRNDYYRDYVIDPVVDYGDLFIDKRSGTLLGKEVVENTPILNKKLERSNKRNYIPEKVYKYGDKVIYSGDEYVSLSNYNVGNIPVISKKWKLC